MSKDTKEIKLIEEKLKYLNLDLTNIPKCLLSDEKISYRPLKNYDDNNYKVYRYVNVKDIEILITPLDRLDDLNDKIKKAVPLSVYLNSESEDTIKEHTRFLGMLKNLDIDKIEELEEEQKNLNKNIPYEIKYKNNYIWQIYYSEIDDKYFMLFSCNENNWESLFYLIKNKIKAQKSRKKEMIFVPISHMDYGNTFLKKSEIEDLSNYLWFFTKEWPSIYEVYNEKSELQIEIIGKTSVYEKIKSLYKISMQNKNESQKIYKLLKALFILQSNNESEYDFKTIINENGTLDFCYNLKKINYENLSEFIRQESETKQEKIKKIFNDNLLLTENLGFLKETVEKQKEEFLIKEKQITNYLECKKTFLGKVKFYFKKSNKKKESDKQLKAIKKALNNNENDKVTEKNSENNDKEKNEKNTISQIEKIEIKDFYTIEDLLKICDVLVKEENKFKNVQMDIKALENKKENLEKKINNATLYINEIESHKKSIFEFWKFANKDESNLLQEGINEQKESQNKLKKQFDFEVDFESLAKKVDSLQRETLTKNECDAIFASYNDIDTFNVLGKNKVLKKDDLNINKVLNNFKKEYEKDIEIIKAKDFDIFGNVAEDKTKIKTLKNNKHREIEKDKYKILDINLETTVEEYKDNLINYRNLLLESYGKIQNPYDMSIYKIDKEELNEKNLNIFNINPFEEIQNNEEKNIQLYKLNIKEKMPVIYYSNIMFYDNMYHTLPLGMDMSTKVLIDLKLFDLNLISRKDFYINKTKNIYENETQLIQVFEYNVERKID